MANFSRPSLSLRGEQNQPAVTATRVVFAMIGAAAMVLGYIGLDQYLARSEPASRDPFNLAYGTIQLFVLGSDPLEGGTDFPLTLQIARFAAPVVTLFALTEAIRLLLSTELRRWRARRSRGHVVVCGDTSVARAVAARLHSAGDQVIVVRVQPIGPLELRRRSLLGVNGDARDPDVLRGAGVARATVLYACTEQSAANLRIAAQAAHLADAHGGELAIYAQIHEPGLALTMQARRLSAPDRAGRRLDFFHLDQLAVQVLLAQQPLSARPGGQVPRVLVAGDSSLARALLVELARHWRLRRKAGDGRIEVDFVAADAAHRLESVARQHLTMREGCRIVPHEGALADFVADADPAADRYDRAFLFFADEKFGLQTALTEYRLWHRVSGDIVVAVDALAELADAFGGQNSPPLLDPLDGRLKLFSPVAAGCDPKLITEDISERLARLIHERYLMARMRNGDRMGSAPAMVDWSKLHETLRESNRQQAADIGPKLRLVECAIVPRSGVLDGFRFTDEEVERLARHESRRWAEVTAAAARRSDAWSDDRHQQYLTDWEDLPPDGRERCRAAIRDIPEILREAGFQVVRMTDTGANRALDPA